MLNLFRKKEYCPFCKEQDKSAVSIAYEDRDKYDFPAHAVLQQKNSSVKLVLDKGYKIYNCTKCGTDILVNGRDFICVNDKRHIIEKWYKDSAIKHKEYSNLLTEIGFSSIGESDDLLLPCKIKVENAEIDLVTAIASKHLPIYHLLYLNRHLPSNKYFFLDEINDLSKSTFGISQEIRNSKISAGEVSKNYFPTILETKQQQKVLIEGMTLFFNSGNIVGSDLFLAEQDWNKTTEYTEDHTTKTNAILLIRLDE